VDGVDDRGDDGAMEAPVDRSTVAVIGASGYVGGRLVPELLTAGYAVRCVARDARRLAGRPWSDDVEIVHGDLDEDLSGAFAGAGTVCYLAHSLGTGPDFEDRELRAARRAREAAERDGVRRIVYLGGLGADDAELSPHLRSRHRVGMELAAGPIEVIELRAAVVLGAGSASFEMLRSLVEVLPVMIAPRWVTRTRVQPVAIADVLVALVAAVSAPPGGPAHRVVELGGPDRTTYAGLMHAYARAAGLRRRLVVPVPFVTPRLSAHWVDLVTPLPGPLARALIDSLVNDVVVRDAAPAAELLGDHRFVPLASAIEASISAVQDLDIPTRWSGAVSAGASGGPSGVATQQTARPAPWDPDWAGGTVLEAVHGVEVDATPAATMDVVRQLGGDHGWHGFEPLWSIRGALDELLGGVGRRRGRRHPTDLRIGDTVDFFRAVVVEPELVRLRAELRLPGEAWLEWSVREGEHGRTSLEQRARFAPAGVAGRAYWYAMWPFHVVIFATMVRRIAAAAQERSATGREAGR
jgi:uncharacterized protein YbjT (DUF2867 family)